MEPNRREEILSEVTNELTRLGHEVTTENLYWCLQGLKEGWMEDTTKSLEKSLYLIALNGLLLELKFELIPQKK